MPYKVGACKGCQTRREWLQKKAGQITALAKTAVKKKGP